MKVFITGAYGFLGRNLRLRLAERSDVEVRMFGRGDPVEALPGLVGDADLVYHLAGVNRPQNLEEFASGNTDLTRALCAAVAEVAIEAGRRVPIVFTSSIQAVRDNAYGHSKLAAEEALRALQADHEIPIHIFRLPNVFGKWCRPNYNSAVATFCHNVAHGLPIQVNDPAAPLNLVYVDDVVQTFLDLLDGRQPCLDDEGFSVIAQQYTTSVGAVARQIEAFRDSRTNLITERVGEGLTRALYATYVSYLPTDLFAYSVPQHADPRGVFVEMLKTPDCGQFSFFTAHPGVTRGGHYHHSKTEKFLVIKGRALFKFRHMDNGTRHEIITDGSISQIVETIPGWTHDITNIGNDELVVMLWANEVFDRARPDTIASKV